MKLRSVEDRKQQQKEMETSSGGSSGGGGGGVGGLFDVSKILEIRRHFLENDEEESETEDDNEDWLA